MSGSSRTLAVSTQSLIQDWKDVSFDDLSTDQRDQFIGEMKAISDDWDLADARYAFGLKTDPNNSHWATRYINRELELRKSDQVERKLASKFRVTTVLSVLSLIVAMSVGWFTVLKGPVLDIRNGEYITLSQYQEGNYELTSHLLLRNDGAQSVVVDRIGLIVTPAGGASYFLEPFKLIAEEVAGKIKYGDVIPPFHLKGRSSLVERLSFRSALYENPRLFDPTVGVYRADIVCWVEGSKTHKIVGSFSFAITKYDLPEIRYKTEGVNRLRKIRTGEWQKWGAQLLE